MEAVSNNLFTYCFQLNFPCKIDFTYILEVNCGFNYVLKVEKYALQQVMVLWESSFGVDVMSEKFDLERSPAFNFQCED